MHSSTATFQAPDVDAAGGGPARRGNAVLWTLAGLTALGVAVRFASLGVQSYHHDEVVTAARVVPGSFMHMLHEVKTSESNPPLYYVLAWGWAKLFGTGEVGLRSLSALVGAATVPIAYPIGRELASRRAGLVGAAILAVSPMLIWYSQEARSYALVVFFGALSLLFFVRALRTGKGSDLALWSVASALAFCSHYFAAFQIAIEAVWLLVALRGRRQAALAAIGGVAVVGLALLPLIAAQVNPQHISWIGHSLLSSRLFETAVGFLAGETGHVIGEPLRPGFAILPAVLIGAALLLVALRGSEREKQGAALGVLVGLGVVLLALIAALLGKDYVMARNVLPALVPLAAVAAIGFTASGARRIGLLCAILLCAYWLAFDVYVTRTPSLQRPEVGAIGERIGPPAGPRAIVTWKLSAGPLQFYLKDGARQLVEGRPLLEEVEIVSKPVAAGERFDLPRPFRFAARIRLRRFTLTRYVARRPSPVGLNILRALPTGFPNAIVLDGLPLRRAAPR